ncbi:Zn(II)2Cys6 transcription factor domain-containing protein [Aspergillus glaucus CBS 516.65]|uniref:Zn(2)-C6 fungal-type domain-containing protein n=1 Tax=Aspergillus glaucus CBS 516.65 TaxID=1160497 RepID=A0A1L9V3N0_ASPGL|nr:hypothetical protein ASPGLDRAFT_182432 [Aspergillus glaucus CBS 516.65]OJJ78545.1 hypothetical protein ASPGLDRAFT_182432 [Aspergillus glaucus CBS 516.65]
MRHRRRCLQSNKFTTRRKACNACVQAKAKCCYTQPTCSRCAKRGIRCEYVTIASSESSTNTNTDSADDPPTRTPEAPAVTTESLPSSSGRSLVATSATDQMDFWSSHGFPWFMDMIDIPSLPSSSTTVINEVAYSMPAIPNAYSNPISPLTSSQQMTRESIAPQYHGMSGMSDILGLGELGNTTSPAAPLTFTPNISAACPSNCMRLLLRYPMLLLQDDFYCPFLHRNLFNEEVPDMTVLPHTSVAICCGSGLIAKEGAHYVKRAMNAQRHSLIEAYPNYHCMEQWDALHAMLLYEILELGVPPIEESNSWKQKPRAKGLIKSPFLAKMTRCFSQSYLETHDASLMPSVEANNNASWVKWAVTETARRTIFLANIVNFFSNRDHESKRQSAYYEPLNDDLIMNMPLPCSHALWGARTEEEWKKARQMDGLSSPTATAANDNDPFSTFMRPPGAENAGDGLLNKTSQLSLKSLFSNFTKDYLRVSLEAIAGFGDSNELRFFIVLCALEQFA